VRNRGLALAAVLLFAASFGPSGSREGTAPASHAGSEPITIKALLARPGEETALLPGGADFQVGPIRFTFVIIRHDGQPVYRPTARVWVATGLNAKPFAETTARLEPIGLPGKSAAALGGVTKIYETRFVAPKTGKLWLVTEPDGGRPIQGVANVIVKQHSFSPAVGSKAIPSQTPTIASTHGNLKALTTRIPPDRALLRYSIAGSLAAHRPFVVTFATPKFCSSRTCGPVVDVVDAVRRQFAGSGIRFIHVEVYEKNDPSLGPNPWFKAWHLPSEPWTFVVGSDGRIKAKFEGSFSVEELAAAVKRYLQR
jgi:hypothetical protein